MRTLDVKGPVNERRTMIAVLIASVVFASCAAAPRSPGAPDAATRDEAALTRTVLTDAAESAKAYGQAHLGHYLDLNVRRLRRQGLEVPRSISLSVRTTHDSYCIKVANEDLPSIHPWALASVRSGDSEPSSEDRCER